MSAVRSGSCFRPRTQSLAPPSPGCPVSNFGDRRIRCAHAGDCVLFRCPPPGILLQAPFPPGWKQEFLDLFSASALEVTEKRTGVLPLASKLTNQPTNQPTTSETQPQNGAATDYDEDLKRRGLRTGSQNAGINERREKWDCGRCFVGLQSYTTLYLVSTPFRTFFNHFVPLSPKAIIPPTSASALEDIDKSGQGITALQLSLASSKSKNSGAGPQNGEMSDPDRIREGKRPGLRMSQRSEVKEKSQTSLKGRSGQGMRLEVGGTSPFQPMFLDEANGVAEKNGLEGVVGVGEKLLVM